MFGSKFIPATIEDFEKQYKLLKEDPNFMDLVEVVGGYGPEGRLLATYDDHDYGVNNGDRTYVKSESQTAFGISLRYLRTAHFAARVVYIIVVRLLCRSGAGILFIRLLCSTHGVTNMSRSSLPSIKRRTQP